jgi:competence protein ComEA
MNKNYDLISKLISHRKTLFKLMILAVLLAVALSVYLNKMSGEGSKIVISDDNGTGVQSEITDSEPGVLPESLSPGSLTMEPVPGETKDAGTIPENIVVDVAGAVEHPSVFILPSGSRLYEALDKAGGVTAEADLRNINKAVTLSDGDRIYIPTKEETESGAELPEYVGKDTNVGLSNSAGVSKVSNVATAASSEASASSQSAGSQGGSSLVNINTADSTELQRLNGVGPATADKIITYRNKNGRFQKIDDIKKVSGIGAKTFEKLKDMITV